MAKIERVDTEGSFTTLIKVTSDNGKETVEIHVPVWEADVIETKVKGITWSVIKALQATKGSRIIKGSA